jgi:ribonuclease inhibitor
MKEIVFDSLDVENLDQLHAELARLLEFPDYYGGNLDALYDCLSGEIALPLKIIWKNYALTKARIGEEVAAVLEVLEDFANEESAFIIETA